MLDIQHITKSFGGVQAVRDCSFRVEDHKVTALIGPNGAGKTTLFNIVNGFTPADMGQVVFAGHDVTTLPAWQRSRLGMSRTWQLPRLFRNLSLEQNWELACRQDDDKFWRMLFGRKSEREFASRIAQVAELVNLHKDLAASITALSYGEQKLFDLGRALLNPHSILLLDEPVAGVNPVVRGRLRELILKLKARGETILLIEHDMDFVRQVADHVIVMAEGTVLAQGEGSEVLRNPRVLEAYLGPAYAA